MFVAMHQLNHQVAVLHQQLLLDVVLAHRSEHGAHACRDAAQVNNALVLVGVVGSEALRQVRLIQAEHAEEVLLLGANSALPRHRVVDVQTLPSHLRLRGKKRLQLVVHHLLRCLAADSDHVFNQLLVVDHRVHALRRAATHG